MNMLAAGWQIFHYNFKQSQRNVGLVPGAEWAAQVQRVGNQDDKQHDTSRRQVIHRCQGMAKYDQQQPPPHTHTRTRTTGGTETTRRDIRNRSTQKHTHTHTPRPAHAIRDRPPVCSLTHDTRAR